MDTCNQLVQQALTVFSGPEGINGQLASIGTSNPLAPLHGILRLSAALDNYEKAAPLRYPAATVYLQKIKNNQTERFRLFSGTGTLVIEIRVSGDRAEELEATLNSYVQATCQVLESSRGAWTEVGTYAGGYEVKFQPLRPGGRQFIKSAQIEFEIQINR